MVIDERSENLAEIPVAYATAIQAIVQLNCKDLQATCKIDHFLSNYYVVRNVGKLNVIAEIIAPVKAATFAVPGTNKGRNHLAISLSTIKIILSFNK